MLLKWVKNQTKLVDEVSLELLGLQKRSTSSTGQRLHENKVDCKSENLSQLLTTNLKYPTVNVIVNWSGILQFPQQGFNV
jgi:hypothetical protein